MANPRQQRLRPLLAAAATGLPRTCDDCAQVVEGDWLRQTERAWGQCGWELNANEAVLLAAPGVAIEGGPLASCAHSADAAVLVSLPGLTNWSANAKRLVRAGAALAAKAGCAGLEALGTYGAGRCCRLQVDWLVALGFTVVRDHPLTPKLRLDLHSSLSLHLVESAWQRLGDLVRPFPPPKPAMYADRQ